MQLVTKFRPNLCFTYFLPLYMDFIATVFKKTMLIRTGIKYVVLKGLTATDIKKERI